MISTEAPRPKIEPATSIPAACPARSAPGAASDRAWLLLRLARTGRDVVSYTAGGERNVLLNHPDLARHVLATNRANYTKDTGPTRYFKTAMADGVLTADGARWRHQRDVLTPAFRQNRRLAEVAEECVAGAIARLDRAAAQGEAVNLAAEMAQVTLAITTRALFGLDHESFLTPCNDLGRLLDRAASMLPSSCAAAEGNPRESLFSAVRAAVVRTDPDDQGPALAAVLADAAHAGEGVIHQIVTLLLAGYETTANSLTWAWILLCRNRSVYRSWQQALDTGARSAAETKAVFDETLRMYPSAWVIGRRAVAEDVIGKVTIPAGATVTISPFLLHRHPGFWSEPDRFDPARFLPGGDRPTHRYAYIPFGGGSRFCIGSGYAATEAHLILSELGRRYTFHPVVEDVHPEHKFVLRAPDPYPVIVQRRQ